MSHSKQDLSPNKSRTVPGESLGRIDAVDRGLANDGAGYSADTFANDKSLSGLPIKVTAELAKMSAAIATGGSHYSAVTFKNDKDTGEVGVDMLAKLNQM